VIVETIAVGTELLLGQIVNGNAAVIGAALADGGFDAHYQTVVGDNRERIASALLRALERAGAVIITGGIGPTQDDLTREGICLALGRELLYSADYAERLREMWARTGREMPESNLRQAHYPEGAELIPNPKGTAPGLSLSADGRWIFVIPGVPSEMEHLLHHEVIPRLGRLRGDEAALRSRVLRTWGRSESQLAEMIDDLYRASTNPSIAFLASAGEIKIRISAKASGEEEALALIVPVERAIRERLGGLVYGVDGSTLEEIVLGLLSERGWSLGTAESATGGMVAARVTAVPGASAVFRGSLVVYATEVKQSLLGLGEIGGKVVSEETALAMAAAVRPLLGVEVAVAVTGSAGPEAQEQPPGTMVVAIETPEGARARTLRLPGDRERVRTYTTTAALQLTRLAVMGEWW
jgi:nicotinamide-nucleotide amidase